MLSSYVVLSLNFASMSRAAVLTTLLAASCLEAVNGAKFDHAMHYKEVDGHSANRIAAAKGRAAATEPAGLVADQVRSPIPGHAHQKR